LLVRRLGYVAQTVPLVVKEESSATATVALDPRTSQLAEVVVSGVATSSASGTPFRVLKVDSTATSRRVVYQVPPGVEVTLLESPIDAVQRDEKANQQLKDKSRTAAPAPMVMSASAQPQINTISWSDSTRRYTLSGPLKLNELEAIKERLIKMRR
jgi:hypothetical protein